MRPAAVAGLLAGLLVFLVTAASPPTVLDDFEDPTRWEAVPSDGVSLSLASDRGFRGRSMRLDFDFHGKSGWAAVRRKVSLVAPENYEFSFRIRGEAPVNNLEFKLADESGQNVWWSNRRNFEFPKEWQRVAVKKRHISFAWGPLEKGELSRVASLEITITAGTGGKGSVWLDELMFEELPPAKPYARTPDVTATSTASGSNPRRALDANPRTAWDSGTGGGEQILSIDFLEKREFGGLVIDWGEAFPRDYVVESSDDGSTWTVLRRVEGGNGGRDYLFLPESETRRLRLRFSGRAALREVTVEPLEFSASENALFERIAKDAPKGSYPRSFSGEQLYWTIVGGDGDPDEALFSEDAALEPGKGSFSIEPFLRIDGALVGWSGVRTSHGLAEGDLPIPTVGRSSGGVTLETTAVAAGNAPDSVVLTRYRVSNTSRAKKSLRLYLAIRPLQVNPPSQFLNTPGGVTRVRSISRDAESIVVDGRSIRTFPAPESFGASAFDGGDVTEYLRRGVVPPSSSVTDPLAHASAALAWDLELAPGGARSFDLVVPFRPGRAATLDHDTFDRSLAEASRSWREKLDRVAIRVPASEPVAQDLLRTMRSQIAYILINRDGPAIQPGSRSYERSWIRDGSLTSAALLRVGHADVVREFAAWFAPYQFDDGKVPCCVDARGSDPVPENDSHGELLYLIAEYGRYTGDRELLEKLWPNVEKAVAYIDRLRRQRMTDEYRTEAKRAFFGLLPESISHEGYSSKPVHSYWDDFFGVRGLKDSVEIANMLGKKDAARRFAEISRSFENDVLASVQRTIAAHKLANIPASVEYADFDPTSTTTALDPAGELERLPRKELLGTFERYYAEFRRRRSSTDWDGYTPYEIRNVGAFVRLGWVDRAHELLQWFFTYRRPAAWNQWAEGVRREVRKPGFVGDMPHTWVGSDYIRSFLDFFAYERESDRSFVLAAGIPERWLPAGGVSIRGLRTPYGPLGYTLVRSGGELRLDVDAGIRIPPGGLVFRVPGSRPVGRVTIDGRAASCEGRECVIRIVPARILVR